MAVALFMLAVVVFCIGYPLFFKYMMKVEDYEDLG